MAYHKRGVLSRFVAADAEPAPREKTPFVRRRPPIRRHLTRRSYSVICIISQKKSSVKGGIPIKHGTKSSNNKAVIKEHTAIGNHREASGGREFRYFRACSKNCFVRSSRGFPNTSSGNPCSTITPSSIKMTRSDTSRAKAISWVTMIIVVFCSARLRITRKTSPVSSGSRADVGSSKHRNQSHQRHGRGP